MANRRYIDFPIASTSGDTDIILIWQDGANKQTTKATFLGGLPENLEDLNDVVISGLTNGQILRYDSVTGKWENTDQGNLDLNDLNDVSIVSPSNGQVLVYNSSTSKWENSSGGYVPYVGAVTTVDLGAQGIRAGYFRFDTSVASVPQEQGLMFWDADDETVDIILNGYTMKIGEDLFYPVKNQTGSTIAKGTAVRFNGTVGASGRLLIAPFIANGSVASNRFMGVTAEEILNGEDGKVLYFGRVRGINTNAFNEGDILYASTTVAGGYQTAIPSAPNNIVLVAAVVTKSINQGTIFVRPVLASNLNTDEAVKLTSVADKNLLQYQSATSLWENKTLAQVLGSDYVPSTRTITINGTSQDLSANRTYNVGTVTSVGLSSATSGVTIGSTPVTTSGTITLAIATASGSQNGLLSSTDWTTFNNKQNALTNPVTGTGTTNYLPKFTGTSTIGNSIVYDGGSGVGIGTTTIVSKLNILGDADYSNIYLARSTSSNTAQRIAILGRNYAGSDNYGLIGAADVSGANIDVLIGLDGTIGPNRIIFRTASTYGGTTTERMRLTSSGNLGLGVTPSAWSLGTALEIANGAAILGFNNETFIANNAYFNGGWKYRATATAQSYFMNGGEHKWNIAPSGTAGNAITFTQAMTLFSTGNLLVGSPSPISDNGARLQVSGAATFSSSVTAGGIIKSTNAGAGFRHNYNNGSGNIELSQRSDNKLQIYAWTGSAYTDILLGVDGASVGGNVGIGTTSPGQLLTLGGTESPQLSIISNTTTGSSEIYFGDSGAVYRGFLGYQHNGDFMQFATAATERMRITSGGNVLIGTQTNGASKLRIVGLPTSSAGLSSGDVYNLSGVLMIA